MSHRATALALLAAGLLMVEPVHAQAQGEAAARAHYERGVALFDEGQFTAALAEFEAAYEASHRAPILFNIGQLEARLGRSVEAVDTLRRYLAEGGDAVSAERRALVEAEIATQSARIASVTASVTVPGATVSIDDVEVGTAPLPSALRVSAGEHVIAARADGFETARFRFRIAGGESQTVALELVARSADAARLRLAVDVPGADVQVDGRSIGLSPIELPVGLAAGSHRIEVTRPGYVPFDRTIEVAAGTEATLSVDLTRASSSRPGVLTQVVFAVPTTSYTIRVDGERIQGSSVQLPHGLHDLSIEAADMETIERRVDIPQGASFALDPGYRWSAQGRQARRSGAESQRVNGLAIILVGAGIAAGGVGLLVGREIYASERHLGERRAINLACEGSDTMLPTLTPAECDARVDMGMFPEQLYDPMFNIATNGILDVYEGVGVAGYVLSGVGVAAAVGGIVLFATAPSDEQIDATTTIPATVSLDVGPGGLSLRGTF